VIYLYGAVDDGPAAARAFESDAGAPADGPGPVRVIESAPIACLVGDGRPERTDHIESLVDHDRVLNQAMTACTVVPFRFGTAVRDRAELAGRLDSGAVSWPDLFDRVRGRRELALRARPAGRCGPERPARHGREYLRERAGRSTPPALETLYQAMASAAVGAVGELDGTGALKASYLVDEEGIDWFCAQLTATQTAVGGLEVSLTGPWAAYSFVGTSHAASDQKAVR
jgi:Gas vesicle synthesis protein GvpL/GvpF